MRFHPKFVSGILANLNRYVPIRDIDFGKLNQRPIDIEKHWIFIPFQQ